MKAEITRKNKAKFFAQYWGQDIFHWKYPEHATHENVITNVNPSSLKYANCGSLLLKPLSSISDEDASVMRGIIWSYPGYKSIINTHYVVNNLGITSLPIECADIITTYLRSKGYAVDWMGLSVQEMINAGWIKLIKP